MLKSNAVFAGAFVGLTVCLTPAGAGDQKELFALIDKAVTAMGGEAKLGKFKSFTSKVQGTFYVPAKLQFTEEGSVQFPDKVHYDFELDVNGNKLQEVLVIDGMKGWFKLGATTTPLPKLQHSAFRIYFHALRLASLPMELKDKNLKLSHVGEVKVGDRPALGIQISTKDYPDINLFLDKETALPLKSEFIAADYITGNEVTHEFLYSDYKESEGAKVPFKMTWKKDGKLFAEREFTELKPAERFEAGVFGQP